jgi:hypothetical protein
MVRDSGSVVAPVVPVACTELMVQLPATVEAAPVLETEAANAPVVSEIPAKQARTKSKVPKKGVIQTKLAVASASRQSLTSRAHRCDDPSELPNGEESNCHMRANWQTGRKIFPHMCNCMILLAV